MELSSKHEGLIVTLMTTANRDKLKYLVDNNLSLIQFAQSHPKFSKVMLFVGVLSPFIDVNGMSAERIMGFLQKNRPDIAPIVNLNWVRYQIEEVKRWKNG